MFLRNYAGGSTDFVQKVSRSYSRPVNLKLPLVEYKKIKAALPANHKILLTGSLLTKDAPHKDYDIVMLVDALEDSITLKETLPKTIDGVKCDYFFLVRPSHSFYAATLDVENKILYTSSWFNLHLASLPEGVTVFSCDTSGAAELLKDTFHDRNLSVQQGISYMRAVLFGNKVSDEVKVERDATCSMCPFMRVSTDAKTQYCGICGCNTQPKDGVSMTAYEENLPHWGCKHPKRKEGQGWKR
jgi:hypothetical protein